MFEGLRKPMEVVVIVVTLHTSGCPVQAIVHAFGLDERTVANWRDRAGAHCEQVHHALVEAGKLDLVHVQADEIGVKGRNMIAWMGLAMMVSTRLWLAGTVSLTRDKGRGLRVDATGAPIGPDIAPLACFDGWLGGLSGQHSARRTLEGQKDGRSRSSRVRGMAATAYWNSDQANEEKTGRGDHPKDPLMVCSIKQRSCSSSRVGETCSIQLLSNA
jgi:hypothetical protein